MVAGTPLTPEQLRMILTLLRKGVESHVQIAASLNLSRHTVHRIARIHGIPNAKRKRERLHAPPVRLDDAWIDDAACGGMFGFTEMRVEQQQQWCKGCPVRYECLEFGLAGPTPTVHWDKKSGPVHGGVSAQDLRKLRKLQRETVDLRKLRAEVAS